MRRDKRIRTGLIVLAAIGLVAIALNVLAYKHARAMLYFSESGTQTVSPESMSFLDKASTLFTGVDAARPLSSASDSALLGFQQFLISINPDLYLGAALFAQPDTADLVLLFHGYRADKFALLHEARAFAELGYSTLLIDFRGSGSSSEAYTSVGYDEAEDVVAAIQYARKNIPHSRLFIFGQSMGAAAVLRAVKEFQIQPTALILESVFDRMLSTVENRFSIMNAPSFPSAQLLLFWGGRQMNFDGFSHNPIDYAEFVKSPVLFLHGELDQRAKLSEAQAVFQNIPVSIRKNFHVFDNAKHVSFVKQYPEEWKDQIRRFLNTT
ncbi:MAG: alpha/beta hydrolase [Calditrichia bacterium]